MAIAAIDGQALGLVFSGNSGRYLSPGKHTLLLSCTDETSLSLGNEDGDVYFVNVRVEAEFQAHHTYQFTIGEGLHIMLWDDTAGSAKRVPVIVRLIYVEGPGFIGDVGDAEYLGPWVDEPDRYRNRPPSHRSETHPDPHHPHPGDNHGQGGGRHHGNGSGSPANGGGQPREGSHSRDSHFGGSTHSGDNHSGGSGHGGGGHSAGGDHTGGGGGHTGGDGGHSGGSAGPSGSGATHTDADQKK